MVDDIGRLATGDQVHIVGHLGGDLIHRTSADDGMTWGPATVIASAAGNFPAMYGGLVARGPSVYLITGVNGDMASDPRQMDFRRSDDNGQTWSTPIRITSPGETIYRARVAVFDDYVHVAGVNDPFGSANEIYFRSADGGDSWETGIPLATDTGTYGAGQTVAVDGSTVHVVYTVVNNGVGAGDAVYTRSTDNGASWSAPVVIGEDTDQSRRQARLQIAAADGYVFVIWQREANMGGDPVPADRIGYARSTDGGATWGEAQILPEDTGVNRNHQQVAMAPGGGVHVIWRIGNTKKDDGTGYMHSPDYGATWDPGEVAIDTAGVNHPFSLAADEDAVHALSTGDDVGGMQYAYRPLP